MTRDHTTKLAQHKLFVSSAESKGRGNRNRDDVCPKICHGLKAGQPKHRGTSALILSVYVRRADGAILPLFAHESIYKLSNARFAPVERLYILINLVSATLGAQPFLLLPKRQFWCFSQPAFNHALSSAHLIHCFQQEQPFGRRSNCEGSGHTSPTSLNLKGSGTKHVRNDHSSVVSRRVALHMVTWINCAPRCPIVLNLKQRRIPISFGTCRLNQCGAKSAFVTGGNSARSQFTNHSDWLLKWHPLNRKLASSPPRVRWVLVEVFSPLPASQVAAVTPDASESHGLVSGPSFPHVNMSRKG